MTKCIALLVVVLSIAGCQDSEPNTDWQSDYRHKYKLPVATQGKFLTREKDLHPKVVELASFLEQLPNITLDADFRSALHANGLKREPDWYKDFAHFWYLDEDIQSETDPEKRRFRIAIGYFPQPDSQIIFTFASIERLCPDKPREWLWTIKWPIEPVE